MNNFERTALYPLTSGRVSAGKRVLQDAHFPSSIALVIYHHLLKHSEAGDRYCRVKCKTATIATLLDMSCRTVLRYYQELCDTGLLYIDKRTRYVLKPSALCIAHVPLLRPKPVVEAMLRFTGTWRAVLEIFPDFSENSPADFQNSARHVLGKHFQLAKGNLRGLKKAKA